MSTPPLPVLAISFDAYRLPFLNFGTYLRLSWLPFLIIFAASTGMQFYYRDFAGLGGEGNALLGAMGVFIEASFWLLTIPIATAWIRMLLKGPEHGTRITIGRAEAVYLFRYVSLLVPGLGSFALVIGLFFSIAIFTDFDPDTFFPDASDESVAIILEAVLAPAIAFSLFMISRFLLGFPAAAVGHSSRLRDSFALTKGRMWAVVALLILTLLPEGLGSLASIVWESDVELGPNNGIFSAAWIAIQYYAASWLFFPVSVGALALAYRHLGGMADSAA